MTRCMARSPRCAAVDALYRMRAMQLTVNGDPVELPRAATLAELAARLGLAGQRVAFEVNGTIVPRSQRDAHALRDGDKVEVVSAIGGG